MPPGGSGVGAPERYDFYIADRRQNTLVVDMLELKALGLRVVLEVGVKKLGQSVFRNAAVYFKVLHVAWMGYSELVQLHQE
jgi:hypothetical protein